MKIIFLQKQFAYLHLNRTQLPDLILQLDV